MTCLKFVEECIKVTTNRTQAKMVKTATFSRAALKTDFYFVEKLKQ